MSELMLNQIQHILNNVTDSLQEMGDNNSKNNETFLGALDDIAANIMATQAIVGVLIKKYPVELEEVLSWLQKDIDGEVPARTKAVATYLVTGEVTE